MSKRSSASRKIVVLLSAILAFLLLSGTFATLWAQTTNPIVGISKVLRAPLGQYAYVDITLDNPPGQPGFGGFDFLIAFDASVLTLSFLNAGALLDSCGWEYFTYRYGPLGNCGGPCPSGMLRLVAVAETNNGNVHPACHLEGKSGKLATIKFLVTSDAAYECQFTPIRFGWYDCSQNVMSSPTGDSLSVSYKVFDFENIGPRIDPNYEITGSDCGLPFHYGGACAGCDSVNAATPKLVFWDGGVDIVCWDSIDARGDLNLNGIANEIADLVMYDNYFMHGISAFPPNGWMGSIAASDINADGERLTFRDVAYMMRIIFGDALPFPKRARADSLNAYFHQDTTNHRVEVTYSGQLAGAFMLIRGNVVPTFLVPPGFEETFYFDGTHTRILILGDLDHRYGSGVWFTYQGDGALDHVETADFHDTDIMTFITGTPIVCGDINGSGDVDISDAVYIVRYIFGGGQPPFGGQVGDLNCDGSCDISDAVYLMQYIFAGGPVPCAGCK
jgi:hypothetical protein